MKSGIYLIKNIINNKVYIGSAINIDKRWKHHKKDLAKGKHHSCLLQRAWDKYGEQNFKFEIIEEVQNPVHLLSYEQVFLDYYKSYEDDKGYNICKIAGSRYGLKSSKETKQKLREAHIGKKFSEEHKKKIKEANVGRKLSQEHKNKLTGKKHSLETKQKLREAHIGKKLSEETKQKLKEINLGKTLSEEHKKKISESLNKPEILERLKTNIGKKASEEAKQKMREANIGRKHSEETKQKLKQFRSGKKLNEETKQKLREAHIGKKLSEETKQKMSEAKRNRKDTKYYSFNKEKKKYRVKIWGKYIGYYNTEEEAKQAVIINLEKLKVQEIFVS
jgi:group I intron endonuclease